MFSSARFMAHCVAIMGLASASFALRAQDLPWHLGSMQPTAVVAPSALNTAGVKPGPNEVVVAVILLHQILL